MKKSIEKGAEKYAEEVYPYIIEEANKIIDLFDSALKDQETKERSVTIRNGKFSINAETRNAWLIYDFEIKEYMALGCHPVLTHHEGCFKNETY